MLALPFCSSNLYKLIECPCINNVVCVSKSIVVIIFNPEREGVGEGVIRRSA